MSEERQTYEYFVHISRGERWDQLAERYYGRAQLYAPLISANPLVPITPTVPAGTRLVVPVLSLDNLPAQEGEQPPWR